MASNQGSVFSDFNAAAAWAGITAFVWYAFGGVPLQLFDYWKDRGEGQG